MASHPWSNSYPSGEAAPVLRAYFPSIASSVWYVKAAKMVAQMLMFGIFECIPRPSIVIYGAEVMRVSIVPMSVTRFGAIHMGKKVTALFQNGVKTWSIKPSSPDTYL